MRETELPVTFQPSGRTVFVLPGTRLLEAAVSAGAIVDSPCGGEGICGKCRVQITSGGTLPTAAEQQIFSREELESGWRLACQSTIEAPSRVAIPESSLLLSRHQQILVESNVQSVASIADPPIRKQFVELPLPCRGSDDPDLLRLEKTIGPFEVDLQLIRELPFALRKQQFRGTAVLADQRLRSSCGTRARGENCSGDYSLLLDFEPENTQNSLFAVAVDIGTTTLAAQLLDVSLGSELGVSSRLNPQTRYGDDVVSRILFARENPEGLRELHETIVEAVNEMIDELCRTADIRREQIYEITFAGNTTMQHLLAGINTRNLGEVPFVPVIAREQSLRAAALGLRIHPRGRVYIFPAIGGFVGGDTTAGIFASGMIETSGPTLLVDIGTNGEIVLWANGRLTAASTAAGPAFEGARISCGMRGSTGAIEKVVADGRLRINVIGNVPPVGLCGSGLIDTAAELLRHGVLNPQGRLLDSIPASPTSLREDLLRRIVSENGKVSFLLATAEESATGKPIALTQRDFRELQLATGAIRAGIVSLLQRAGLQPRALEQVYIAGGFGNFIRRNNAQRIGLLPHEIEHRRIRYVGNTSLAGARMAALSLAARRETEELARRTEHVDLSLDPAFQNAFADAMIFPENPD